MTKQSFYSNGTLMNKIAFAEIESVLESKGFDLNAAFCMMADENENIYVSDGFLRGLREENKKGEWHHYFTKSEGSFVANKFYFA